MTPFLYPKLRHHRQEQPPQYKQYPRYKPYLRREFKAKCIYCRLPDTLKGNESFGVEHYRPKKRFPSLEVVYSNLFYSCNCCNSRKGDFWPDQAQLDRGAFIPNPCDHVIFEHLRFTGTKVEPRTSAGHLCEELLDLNDDDSVAYREFVLGLIKSSANDRNELQIILHEIDAASAIPGAPPGRLRELSEARSEMEARLVQCEHQIARLLGEPA